MCLLSFCQNKLRNTKFLKSREMYKLFFLFEFKYFFSSDKIYRVSIHNILFVQNNKNQILLISYSF